MVFDQAENRLHAQKALLLMLLAEPTRLLATDHAIDTNNG